MKSFVVATLFIAGVLAVPSPNVKVVLCAGLDSTPQCCSTDVLGVADLNCASPSGHITNVKTFKAVCAAGGQQARCCAIPIAGQALLCTNPVGN